MTLAKRFLAKAFNRAQAAQARGKPAHIRLPLSKAQCPDYFAMRSLDDATKFRAELTTAERLGAIRIDLAPRLVPPRDVEAVPAAAGDLVRAHQDRPGADGAAHVRRDGRERPPPAKDFGAAGPATHDAKTIRGRGPTSRSG